MSGHVDVAALSDTGSSASGNREVDIDAGDLVLQMEGTVPKQKIKPKFSFGNKSITATVSNSLSNRQQILLEEFLLNYNGASVQIRVRVF
jgi:hypothetical protein